ncbi:GNAT family N-acetyltransferase [Aporhodopirellula aestuarii]|uniref:GNAT family N-acetyltransferase n=1 Tax=Aporhodopirellula aestuarii TaxID=2950107 RepID=A0ABT0UDX7_9BACT|nr:GNAT family N-acetyltransferase [Aporhodopirellula aestuarii]MCM2374930.1 GNAT family N-acetyltransferase [Aporhodopirellula aestuarii]
MSDQPARDFICETLAKRHDRKQFTCGVEALDNYLRQTASQDVKRKTAAVFVMVPEDEPKRIAGFYTLCATSVELTGLPIEIAKRLPRYPQVPGILMGRLARDESFPGIGRLLLADALSRCVRSADDIAAALIVVDAKDAAAVAFYQKFGFLLLPKWKSRLFLPMATASKL